MRPGDALLVHGTLPPAHIRTRPYYRERRLAVRAAHQPVAPTGDRTNRAPEGHQGDDHEPPPPTTRQRAPLPDGWTTEPAGQWNGHEVEIAYDPRRHDFMLVQGPAADDIDGRLEQIGYQFIATDGQTWLWYRDRFTAARNALERTPGASARVSKSLGL